MIDPSPLGLRGWLVILLPPFGDYWGLLVAIRPLKRFLVQNCERVYYYLCVRAFPLWVCWAAYVRLLRTIARIAHTLCYTSMQASKLKW